MHDTPERIKNALVIELEELDLLAFAYGEKPG